MGNKIVVNPTELRNTASKIDSMSDEYQKLYNDLYNEVGNMSAVWRGEDNIAFTSQIEGFRDDFEKMSQLMKEYSQFLKTAAQTYEKAQDETVAAARRLQN